MSEAQNPWDEVDLDGIDPETLQSGFDQVYPGGYHLLVTKMGYDNKTPKQMIVDFEVQHGLPNDKKPIEDEVGKSHREYFTSSSPDAMKRAFVLAVACGVVTEDQLKTMRATKQKFGKWHEIEGKHLKAEFKEETYNGKKRSKIGFGMYTIDHPKMAHVPVNQAALAGETGGENPFGGDEGGTAADGGAPNPFGT